MPGGARDGATAATAASSCSRTPTTATRRLASACRPTSTAIATFNGRGRPPWVEVADAPDAYRGGGRADAVEAACARLEERGIRVGALFVESGASVAGVRLPPEGFLSKAFEAVRRRGGIVVADEVQTGLGRLGSSWYAFEAHGVAPDVVTVGKPFGNGLPLAAAVVARAVSDAFAAGPEYFNTFGGNPACCAAGLAVLEAIEADGLRANATRVGAELRKGFERLMGLGGARCVVGDVRGRGLFLGVDLVRDAASKAPATAEASWICARLVTRHRILTSLDGPGDNVARREAAPLLLAERRGGPISPKRSNHPSSRRNALPKFRSNGRPPRSVFEERVPKWVHVVVSRSTPGSSARPFRS